MRERIIAFFLLNIALFGVIFVRLVVLQVYYGDYYKTLSDGNRIQTTHVPAPRGRILDCQGNILADNIRHYRASLCADNYAYFNTCMAKVSHSENDLSLKAFAAYKGKPYVFQENLSWEEMTRLESLSAEWSGLVIDETYARHYPDGKLCSHLIGHIAPVNDRDLSRDPTLNIPGLCLGRGGIEQQYDHLLRGEAGWRQEEVDAKRRLIRSLDHSDGTPGQDIHTTIDHQLQTKIVTYLEEKEIKNAAVVVMDVHTGAVKALVSHPGYDGNIFATKKIDRALWQQLNTDTLKPLLNRALQGQYAPGSTFKMIIALAALRYNLVPADMQCHCPGYYDLPKRRFHCWTWRRGGHGLVKNIQQAIAGSCDVYFYRLAQKLSVAQIADTARKFGFGEITGIDIPYEKAGIVPTVSWVKSFFRYSQGDVMNLSIGQGKLSSTLLQLVRMTAALVNGGYLVKPHIVSTDQIIKQPIALKNFPEIKEGMDLVVNAPYGTGYRLRMQNAKGEPLMGGKTGTTQVRSISLEERRTGLINRLSYEQQDHSLFVAYGPVDKPAYAVAVVVEHGGSGSAIAGPVAQLALKEILP